MWEWIISKHMPEKEKPHKMSKQDRENFSHYMRTVHPLKRKPKGGILE